MYSCCIVSQVIVNYIGSVFSASAQPPEAKSQSVNPALGCSDVWRLAAATSAGYSTQTLVCIYIYMYIVSMYLIYFGEVG